MKNNSLQNWGVAFYVALAAGLFVTVTGWLLAAPSPSQEITHAVAANGKHDVKTAAPDTFIYAFTSVLVNSEKEQSGVYVAAAKSLRPDLSGRITATAAEVDRDEDGDGDGDDRDRVSRHRRRCRVCDRDGERDRDGDHDGDGNRNRDGNQNRDGKHHDRDDERQHTILIPCNRVDEYLEKHPEDRRGACPRRHED